MDKIAVIILDIEEQPRGRQYIQVEDLPKLKGNFTGNIVWAKVLKVKYGHGDIILSLIK